ncbi:MAG: hypothetical protein NDI94_03650 [Candidatus Woesearchaeota archaeon]|nr:hypothetical protein [Candidatus Woesearchaeota archaeon]
MGDIADMLMQKMDLIDYPDLDEGTAIRVEHILEIDAYYGMETQYEALPLVGAMLSLAKEYSSLKDRSATLAYSDLIAIIQRARNMNKMGMESFKNNLLLFADLIKHAPEELNYAFADAELVSGLALRSKYSEVIESYRHDSYGIMSHGLRTICSSEKNYHVFLALKQYKDDFGQAFTEHVQLLSYDGNRQMLESYIQARAGDLSHADAIKKSWISTLPIYKYEPECRVFTAARPTFARLPG